MTFNRAASERLTVLHEGRCARAYKDSLGKVTVGIGCYMDRGGVPELFARLGIDFAAVRSGAVALTDAQIDAIFARDLDGAIGDARADCPMFDDLPAPAQLVLVDQAFQLGRGGLARFTGELASLARADWDGAARELLDSEAARQTPTRARGNAALLHRCALPITVTPIDLVAGLNMPGSPTFSPSERETEPDLAVLLPGGGNG